MASSLAQQLSQIAAKSTNSLDLRAQKAAHARSLLFDPKVAATQDFDTIYTICAEAFHELARLDPRFLPFARTIFSEQSKQEDRTQLTESENHDLDKVLEDFLSLVGARLLLKPAVKAVEWLVRRFRVHEYNTIFLVLTFLPYHTTPIFTTLLSILPATIPPAFHALNPSIRSLTNPTRHVLVSAATRTEALSAAINAYVLRICKARHHYPALLTFWSGLMTEVVAATLDRARSGRATVRKQQEEDVLVRWLPILSEALAMKKVPHLRIGSYMIVTIMASKAQLDDQVLSRLMEAVLSGWTTDTLIPGLMCLAVLAQKRDVVVLPKAVVNGALKVDNLLGLLTSLKPRCRVDRLAAGLVVGGVEKLGHSIEPGTIAFIEGALTASFMSEPQAELALRSLFAVAQRLNPTAEDGPATRQMIAELVIRLVAADPLKPVMATIMNDDHVDMDAIEMRLEAVLRPAPDLTKDGEGDIIMDRDIPSPEARDPFRKAITSLPSPAAHEVSLLSSQPSSLFSQLAHAFTLAVRSPTHVAEFTNLPMLRRDQALQQPWFFSFFIRVWSGPMSTITRSAALTIVAKQLPVVADSSLDLQALLAYVLTALADPAERVRRSAVELLVTMREILHGGEKSRKRSSPQHPWGVDGLYAEGLAAGIEWLSPKELLDCMDQMLLPDAEECILDAHRLGLLFEKTFTKSRQTDTKEKTGTPSLSSSTKVALFSSLSSQIVATPLLTVKLRLLTVLNRARKVGGSSRTKLLLPVLQQWTNTDRASLLERCKSEQIRPEHFDLESIGIITAGNEDGLVILTELMMREDGSDGATVRQAAGERLRELWPGLKPKAQAAMATSLLDVTCPPAVPSTEHRTMIRETTEALRSIRLPPTILADFLDRLQLPEGPTQREGPKRRRTDVIGPSLPDQSDLSWVIRRMTFVLELVDSSEDRQDEALLRPLFRVLGDLQQLTLQLDSELAYLHELVLGNVQAILDGVRESSSTRLLDPAAIRADLVIDCLRSTSNAQVQQAGLLVLARLASLAPELVLHSVMPVFTFMGTALLRQDDEYSVHVINQTIEHVVPPLVASLRQQDQNLILGTAELLLSFVAAFDHIPAHRRLKLYTSLVQTLGEEEFLSALLAMLANKFPGVGVVESFTQDLAMQFPVPTQLKATFKCMELAMHVLQPEDSPAKALLCPSDAGPAASVVALRLLRLIIRLLSAERMVARVGQAFAQPDTTGAPPSAIFSAFLQQLLGFASRVRGYEDLHDACGTLLKALLHLLSTPELITVVGTLLDGTDDEVGPPHEPLVDAADESQLRRRSLKAFEVRVEGEKPHDAAARTAIVSFVPRILRLVQSSDDALVIHAAIACIDRILEKYGKKDIPVATAAAEMIVGGKGLGHADARLRVLSLLSLASCVEILGAGIIPILPHALPQTFDYLQTSVADDGPNGRLHDACCTFVEALLTHVPWMMTSAHVDRLIHLSHRSAAASLGGASDESRRQLLQLLPRQVEVKECLAAVDRGWSDAVDAGPTALEEHVQMLGICVERQTKSVIVKHASALDDIILKALDVRRAAVVDHPDTFSPEDVTSIEQQINKVLINVIMKMNDTTFRPIFTAMVQRLGSVGKKRPQRARTLRLISFYGFLHVFFDQFRAIVTGYASYVLASAVDALQHVSPDDQESLRLWALVHHTLAKALEHDQDDFWQSPDHFDVIAPVLLSQLARAATLPIVEMAVPTITALAGAVDSGDHHKRMNAAILKHMRSEEDSVRLAAIQCEEALTDRLGEEWLALLPEMLPFISELQEDDDEDVERETHRWIVQMEGVLGESLEPMLQ
ncbi:MAG: snoRNA-binding rRNA-processing protein utp10 [Thelocarpon superellum]|nr:MAG: snoRNA-binding rRNA-processing protein utp10 [Thelocarpon superellum]